MCLYIDFNIHFKGKPKIATFPILVYKALTRPTTHGARSPYQNVRYEFGKLYTAGLGIVGGYSVHEGLHSCIIKDRVYSHADHGYPAIIPIGAYYFIGTNNEVVSTDLIVFKNEDDIKKRYKVTEFGKPVSRHKMA